MARAAPSNQFYLNHEGIDLDGVGRDVAKHYLRIQLRQLDTQIEQLNNMQLQDAWHMLERASWGQPAAAEVTWSGRLELFYLEAVRDALLETLASLK